VISTTLRSLTENTQHLQEKNIHAPSPPPPKSQQAGDRKTHALDRVTPAVGVIRI